MNKGTEVGHKSNTGNGNFKLNLVILYCCCVTFFGHDCSWTILIFRSITTKTSFKLIFTFIWLMMRIMRLINLNSKLFFSVRSNKHEWEQKASIKKLDRHKKFAICIVMALISNQCTSVKVKALNLQLLGSLKGDL